MRYASVRGVLRGLEAQQWSAAVRLRASRVRGYGIARTHRRTW